MPACRWQQSAMPHPWHSCRGQPSCSAPWQQQGSFLTRSSGPPCAQMQSGIRPSCVPAASGSGGGTRGGACPPAPLLCQRAAQLPHPRRLQPASLHHRGAGAAAALGPGRAALWSPLGAGGARAAAWQSDAATHRAALSALRGRRSARPGGGHTSHDFFLCPVRQPACCPPVPFPTRRGAHPGILSGRPHRHTR